MFLHLSVLEDALDITPGREVKIAIKLVEQPVIAVRLLESQRVFA